MTKATSPRRVRSVRSPWLLPPRYELQALESRLLLSRASSFVPGELLVSFNPGVGQADINRFYAQHGLSERDALDRHAAPSSRHLKLISVPAAKTMNLIAELERDPRVAYAEPNYLFEPAAATPSEIFYQSQWNLNNTGQWGPGTSDADIDAPEAWKITTGSPDVVVAVIDTGVDYNHPDLAANMWTNPSEVAGDGIDNDANGYVDDVHGISAVTGSGDPMDLSQTFQGHGTAVAGVIGATPYNEGFVGIAQRVSMIAVSVFPEKGGASLSDIVRGVQYINYLKNIQGVNIVATNNSYGSVENGGPSAASRALKDAMAGLDQPGMSPILHVCAAMNNNSDNDATNTTPAGYDLDNIVSVAATDWNDQYADFSNYGATTVDLAAPGFAIIQTTAPNGRYNYLFSGTSAASPHVAAGAALVWSAFPSLTAAQVKQRLLAGIDPIGQIGNNGSKPTLTNGRLNVARALVGAAPSRDSKPPAAVVNLTASAASSQAVTLSWAASGDDGVEGRASFYDVRYSTSPITKNTWEGASRALGEQGPRAPGAVESFTVSSLDPGRAYYFALKVRDDMGNESPLSNVAQVGTAAMPTPVFGDGMENGTNGWVGTGLWHQSALRSSSMANSWHYGVEATRTYDTGVANAGLLTSPLIDLGGVTAPVLMYREWRQVEDVSFVDSAQVQIGTGANKWTTLSQSELSTSIEPINWRNRASAEGGFNLNVQSRLGTPQWVTRSLDLSAYVGQTVRIRFSFDTIDASFNNFEGWYVDDVNVFSGAPASPAANLPASSGLATSNGDPAAATPASIDIGQSRPVFGDTRIRSGSAFRALEAEPEVLTTL